jgi:stage II sporulation protein D
MNISGKNFDRTLTPVGKTVRTEGGRVKTITIYGKVLDGVDLRNALELPSASYTVTFVNGKFRFEVMGSGHGVGMSQLGADAMAARGCDAIEILTHYYTGCTVENYSGTI